MMSSFALKALDRSLTETIKSAWDQKTKPIHSLGRLEELGLQLGLIQGTTTPEITHPVMMIFAGDHGLVADAPVSPYPQSVTQAMVRNLAQGGAAINVLSRYLGWNLRLIDSGIASPVVDPKVISAAVARGTQSTLKGPAMTKEQYQVALTTGAKLFREQHSQGCRLLACGEMGIGNSSSAALILHALSGVPLEEVINRGAGCNDQQLAQKLEILCEVRSHLTTQGDPELVLQYFAGFEMVMMIGAILQAAELQTPIVIDGLIVSSTCYAALKVQPQLKDYLIFAHRSAAGGHDRCLQEMGVRPLLDLGLCLGEGTGAALALPLLGAACALLREMATFESAAVPERSPT